MATETKEPNIYTALAAAQMEMAPVVKGATNPHFKSKYADLADVMRVALPALNSNGIAAFAHLVHASDVQGMRTVLMHGASGTSIHCDVPLLVARGDMQGMKSATTYAKRIGIESLTGIAPEDDDGTAAATGADKYRKEQQERAAEQEVNARSTAIGRLMEAQSIDALIAVWKSLPDAQQRDPQVAEEKDKAKAQLSAPPVDDEIPDFDTPGPGGE
ncbi:MAG: hypothetical protein GY767_17815 [Shimia sp.]|nr:hypothetical protein [Shimia sp.]